MRIDRSFHRMRLYVWPDEPDQNVYSSIPSNVAERITRQTRKEFVNFLHISKGSLSELNMQLDIVFRLGYFQCCTSS